MFSIRNCIKKIKKYSVELTPGLLTYVITMDDFYRTPEQVSSYEFPTEENLAQDERIRPVYKFLARLSGTEVTDRKSSIVNFSTDGTEFHPGNGHLFAFVNLSDPCTFVFHSKPGYEEPISEPTDSIEPEPQVLWANDNYFDPDVVDSETFRVEVDYNEVVIFDPTILLPQIESTKYQIFKLC